MTSIIVEDIKDFMGRLLIKNDFDNFYLNEMEILTSHRVMINGKINKEWYKDIANLGAEPGVVESGILNSDTSDNSVSDKNTQNNGPKQYEEFMRWRDIKKYAYDCIKGNKTPQYIKMILSFSEGNMEKMVEKLEVAELMNDIGALYLNIKFENNILTLTTAVSYKNFTLDKTVERQWDNYVSKVFG